MSEAREMGWFLYTFFTRKYQERCVD